MNVLKVVAKLLILVSVPVALFGCGGGGSGGDGPPAAGKTRALQAGDSWTYDINGQTVNSNSPSSQYSGTTTTSVTRETLNGESVLAETSVMNLTFNGSTTINPNTSVQYFQQDPSTGDIALYGQKLGNGSLITVTDRPLPVIWPGSWETGKMVTPNIHYSDGDTDSALYTVIGQETVTTPAGTFPAWKLAVNSGATNGTLWFAPQLGHYVKTEITTGSGGASNDLLSTNATRF